MSAQESTATCLSCKRTEMDVPLLKLQFTGKGIHICPQCLPVLIHHYDRLTEKIKTS